MTHEAHNNYPYMATSDYQSFRSLQQFLAAKNIQIYEAIKQGIEKYLAYNRPRVLLTQYGQTGFQIEKGDRQ